MMTTAFVFPGQGSQAVGMLRELAAAYASVSETFRQASEVLGYDLWKLVREGPEAELNMTEHTQPAMLAAGVAVWKVWNESGGTRPAFLAGHSLGEYTALVCSGALAFADAVGLVAARAKCMQAAVPAGEGAMAAVLGLELPELEQVCAAAADGQVVSCANLNAPGQIVIAGHREAVERAIAGAREAGAKRAVLLPVSVPSHCRLMMGAAEQMHAALQRVAWGRPQIPVIHNVDVKTHDSSGEIIAALVRQLYEPVRWLQTVQLLRARGVGMIIECGPGKVLAGLCRRIESDLECLPVFDPASLDAAINVSGTNA
ncbi:MAG: ACP S-malonyltransferase [Gammaproteobacteria bacterium]|nr:ACP S-malonyltransferase [Gammaproteobacteria bacterium]MCG3145195.1 Malonyl CoA-acyl carrier protein transacylase [Gammaproteobacteria bacterium]